jgi:hypothetical protein
MEENEIDQRLWAIEQELKEIRLMLDNIGQTLVTADTTIQKVAAEVMPTLNQVMESPMLRMLTGGKKGK